MMRAILFLGLFVVLAAGCAPSTKVLTEASGKLPSNPVSPQEAFREAETSQFNTGANIYGSVGQVPLVSMDRRNRLVVPMFVDSSRPHTMKVMSYVARKNDGSYILFYPVLSLIDETFNSYLTLKPKYEFDFNENILTNEFEIPAGVQRIMIHTDEQYYPDSFEGTTSAGDEPSKIALGYAGLFGGAVGVLIMHAATHGEEKPFKLGEVGVVSVETN